MLFARHSSGNVTRPGTALARCVDPLDEGEFLAEHWERRPLVVQRDEPGRYDDLLSTADVEELVCAGGLRYPAFRLVKAGERLHPRDYTTDVPWRPTPFTGAADVERVLEEFERGATIVLQALHLYRPPLGEFCRGIERTLGHPAQANAYFTPRAAQGLPVHHDTHDVFVLQIAGEKRWLVYAPVFDLPLRDQRYDDAMGQPGDPVHDVVLSSGDALYLPRGWLHEALTSETDSLHLTIGVNAYTWLDAFRAALDECAHDLEFRRSVADGADGASDLVARLRERLSPDEVERRKRDRLVRTRRPVLDGQLSQLRALERLDSDSEVERRPGVLAELREDASGVALSFAGKTIRFPAHVRAELEHACATDEPFRVDELPGQLDDDGRLVLVRRLVREGFLRFSDRD